MPFMNNIVAKDTYLKKQASINRLIEEYKKHGNIIVAYDFDNTVYSDKPGESNKQVIEILQYCSKFVHDIEMIVFTCRSGAAIDKAVEILDDLGIRHDRINKNGSGLGFVTSNKIFYNIFLDDRAGLRAAYEDLTGFLLYLYGKERMGI